MTNNPSLKPLRIAAFFAILFHVAGLFVALLGIRFGTPVFSADERMAHIATSFYGWKAAWGVWLIAAATYVGFLAAVDHAWKPTGVCARLAVVVGVVAAALDSTFDMLQIVVLPAVAARGPEAKQTFLALADFASVGGIVVANGLYAIAVGLMTFALGERLSKWGRWIGWSSLMTGLLLTVAGFFNNPNLPEIFTGPAIGTYMLWVMVLAWQGPK